MSGPVRFGLRVNNDLDVAILDAIADLADAAGLDRLWVSHDLMYASAPALLARLAARTERLGLGVGIANPYTSHPAELAMTASTLDDLSGGRFALGLGAGAAGFLADVGIARERPLRVMDQTITAVRALLRGAPVEQEGWAPTARLARPAPDVAIYVGATGPRMRALAGRRGDGVLALMLPPSSHHRVRAEVAGGRRSVVDRGRGASMPKTPASPDGPHGPDGSDLPRGTDRSDRSDRSDGNGMPDVPDERFDLPCCVWLSVADDARAATAALAPKLALYGPELGADLLHAAGLESGDFAPVRAALVDGGPEAAGRALTPAMLDLAIVGDLDTVTRQCEELLDDGVEHLSFGPPLGPDPVTATAMITSTLLPRLGHRPDA